MKNKKIMRTLIALVAMGSLISTTVLAAPSADEAQKKVDDIQNKKDAAEGEVTSLQTQLTELLSKMDQLETDMAEKQKEIDTATADLQVAQEKEKQQYQDMKIRIKYMYEEGGSDAELEKILESGSIAEILNQAEYVQSIHSYDRQMLDTYVETKDQVAALKSSLETQKAEMEQLQEDYQAQSDNLNETIEDKSAEIANFDEQLQEAAKEAAAAKEKEELEKAQAAAAAAAASAANTGSGSGAVASTGGGNYSNGGGSSASSVGGSSSSGGGGGGGSYNASTGNAIVDAAYSQIGVPYVWGGTTPGVGLDCSGLVQYCYRCAGISIPRTSGAILAGGTIVSNPQPGDICWTPGHVAIYIGGGQMIEAQQTGTNIMISRVRVTYYVRY